MCCLDSESKVAWLDFLLGMVKCMPENLLLLVYLAFEQVARLLIMRLASDDDGPGSGRSGKARRKTHKGFPVTR